MLTTRCCEQAMTTPAVHLQVEDYGHEKPEDAKAYWASYSRTSHENFHSYAVKENPSYKRIQPLEKGLNQEISWPSSFCPFCGHKHPEVRLRKKKPARPLTSGEEGYCDTCGERFRCCECLPVDLYFEVVDPVIPFKEVYYAGYGFDASEDTEFRKSFQHFHDRYHDDDEYEDFFYDVSSLNYFLNNHCYRYFHWDSDPVLFGKEIMKSETPIADIKVSGKIKKDFKKRWDDHPLKQIFSKLKPDLVLLTAME